MTIEPAELQRTVLKSTQSLCPVCRKAVDAQVVQVGNEVVMERNCPTHGSFAAVINSDAKYYHLSIGANTNAAENSSESNLETTELPLLASSNSCQSSGCCGTPAESLSTCVGFIEIVRSCNLACPVCFADSPHPKAVDALEFDEFRNRVEAVIKRKGPIDILQLSGGEPTIHPKFFQLLEWTLNNESIGHVLLNTNGVKLAGDAFFQSVAKLRQQYGKLEVYLQFDGTQSEGQVELRGLDLRITRMQVIQNCESAGIPVNLAMTVNNHNLGNVGEVLRLAIEHPGVSGITWQPMFGSGRMYDGFNCSHASEKRDASLQWPPTRRLNVADIIHAAVDQSEGVLKEQDFTPLPCGDPNCHTVAYLFRQEGGELLGLASLIDLENLQGFLRDRMNYDVNDLLQCGCESEPLGDILKHLEIGKDSVLRLVIKPFMDVWTYDQHRVDRCCVHVIGEEGQLESFCRHYAMS